MSKDNREELKGTDKYKYCNHHHELTENHTLVDFGDGEFVANNRAIPLLKALNELGLRTRTHHIDYESDNAFFSILLDGVNVSISEVNETVADRTKYNGLMELFLSWKPQEATTDSGADVCEWKLVDQGNNKMFGCALSYLTPANAVKRYKVCPYCKRSITIKGE